ncbi:MAG: hypothetical protein DHS20C18_50490 [Saprospiraceae bacterium]|nr:MAG: hypothetical protein DHS20C18_50490 [Saprospiraceae bacterium]
MDRRATLATLTGRKRAGATTTTQTSTKSILGLNRQQTGLEPYAGPWEFAQATHLLRRCTFGPTYAQMKQATADGLDTTINNLFAELPLPSPPLNYYFEEDPNVPVGESWVDAPYSDTDNFAQYRRRSLFGWTVGQILNEGISLREKMTLFWNNHFAISEVDDPKFILQYTNLYRTYAWGNFRDLVKEMTINPAMLRFLNGNQNTKNAPNENFARELLELFTIGKGPLAGPGDYTNYTEQDVVAMAKVLTGWRDRGYYAVDPMVTQEAFFRPNQHDTSAKQLSPRFDNLVINDMGEQEYSHLIDVIFGKAEVARFISRKLYRWFVYYDIDEEAETEVIQPMAQMLIDNGYEIQPVLEALLRSNHFFDILNQGPMIKNPIDFAFSLFKQLEVDIPEEPLGAKYEVWLRTINLVNLMEMAYYFPPSVSGWKAYYQEPLFYRTWINATTLQVRMGFTSRMASNGYNFGDNRILIKPLEFITTLDNPTEINDLLDELVKILFPQPISDSQKAALKEFVIPGLPDFEWNAEYSQYLSNPDDSDLADAIETKLRSLFNAMLSMPEFYLS